MVVVEKMKVGSGGGGGGARGGGAKVKRNEVKREYFQDFRLLYNYKR